VSIAQVAIEKKTVTVFATILMLVAGLAAYTGLGQLEDPEFTVKTAVVVTTYPGATAEEVELEVTDRIELALQELPQLRELESFSRAGLSLVTVYIQPRYTSEMLPQIWDELRKKVRDVKKEMPPGAGVPSVADDFGDVYGFLMAVVGDGFSPAQLERYVDTIKKELSLVPGVARVELWGEQPECIYIDISEARLAQLGISNAALQRTLTLQNVVVPAGGVEIVNERLRLETTGEFTSPEDIGDLVLRGQDIGDEAGRGELIRIRDIAEVRRGYLEPTNWAMRYGGRSCIGISVSNASGTNVVALGRALERRLDELKTVLPVGIEIEKISWQEDLVAEAIQSFLVSLGQAVAIVLVVLWIFMGLRTAFIVGMTGLVFVIVGSFLFMNLFGIDLQRMSLGALIIAMGMMVDNAIVVADGIIVRMQQGMGRVKAAVEAATQPAWPLLGATFVAVLAFYPIAASDESAGEYCETLFSVVAIALMLSWVLSVTVSPVLCIAMLPDPKKSAEGADPFAGGMYQVFRRMLELAIRLRWLVVLVLLGLLLASFAAFRFVPQMFFPASARPQFMIDYWAPEGTRIQTVSEGLRPLEQHLLEDPRVAAVSTFIGQGPPRFYLPVDPESPYASYGQLIVNVHDYRDVSALITDIRPWVQEHVPEAMVVPRKYGLGPSETWPVEVRISGPAIADPVVLREIAAKAEEIVRASPQALVVRTNWRQRVKKVELDYNEDNARWTGISRADIGSATLRAFDGLPVGQFREEDKLLPILIRHVESERLAMAGNMPALQVRPPITRESVPLSQVTSSIDVEWEDPLVWRWDRRRAITVEAVPRTLATVLRADIQAAVEALELPPGYEMMWDGEYRSSRDAQASLIPGMIPAAILISLIVVGLFNAYRPPLIILLVIPFAMIGVTVGLLATGQPFGFVALLGAMSLAGMMVKNAIVLLDQVNIEKDAGKSEYEAVVYAALSRLRPVMLAAATTVLGVVPLLPDVFWVSMAVTIMFGLAFGAILTMVAVPVLYAILFRLRAS
jgi:multidrug efflux pump subunit AcrB